MNPSLPHHTDELTNTSASDQFGSVNHQLSRASCSQHRVSTNNRTLCAAHFKPPTETHDLMGWYQLEADSHANTLCFSKGWKLDYLTGKQVDVDGFHSSMETMKNIPIGSAYTAMDHPNGNTYILHLMKAYASLTAWNIASYHQHNYGTTTSNVI